MTNVYRKNVTWSRFNGQSVKPLGPVSSVFQFVRTQIAQIRMESKAVVPHRDVFNDTGTSFRTRLIVSPLNPLKTSASRRRSQQRCYPNSRLSGACSPESRWPSNGGGIRDSHIERRDQNENQSFLVPPSPDHHLQGIAGETAIDPVAH